MSKGYAMIAEGLKMMAAGYEQLADAGTPEAAPAKKEETGRREAPKGKEAPKPKEEVLKVDVKDVRAAMRQKIKDGKMEECQDILHSFGYEKLTDVPEDRLGELLAKVEVL